jgi:hypothetical protein
MNGYLLGFTSFSEGHNALVFSVLLPGNIVTSGSPSTHHPTYNSVVAVQCYLTDYRRYRLVIKLLSFHIIYFYLYWGTYFGEVYFSPVLYPWHTSSSCVLTVLWPPLHLPRLLSYWGFYLLGLLYHITLCIEPCYFSSFHFSDSSSSSDSPNLSSSAFLSKAPFA